MYAREPVIPRYLPDGSGRDSYIDFNNGGLYRNQGSSTHQPGGQLIRQQRAYQQDSGLFATSTGPVERPGLRSRADGAGRDSYVMNDLDSVYRPGTKTDKFSRQCRQYQPITW
jgi:hypothetical protein